MGYRLRRKRSILRPPAPSLSLSLTMFTLGAPLLPSLRSSPAMHARISAATCRWLWSGTCYPRINRVGKSGTTGFETDGALMS